MSMHRFAGAGPIMEGLAGLVQRPITGDYTVYDRPERGEVFVTKGDGLMRVKDKTWLVEVTKQPHPDASFAVNGEDLIRMIENIADQLSEVAAQNVELRLRVHALEASHGGWVILQPEWEVA